ncbi:MAG: phosphate ABC transporter ATP-binding protein [Bacteroidales bacterium]|nr:phosphate ABC transporter ATP-binding protein [Bacteroidales bacterium]
MTLNNTIVNEKIQIRDLNLHIGQQHILKDINCRIPEKKITVILGSSGCGKTTLLKSLNRLTDLYPQVKINGSVELNGQNIYNGIKDINDLRRKMGLLSQRPAPLPMNIFNNVAYGLRISGRTSKKFLRYRVEHYLKQANLWEEVKDRLSAPASSLSIGQQQRLCLARGLAVDPEIILADEPTSALDPISSQTIENRFLELKNYYTIILVTHALRQAKRIADYIIFMYLGEIIEQGEASEFFLHPKHDLTKAYLRGSFN